MATSYVGRKRVRTGVTALLGLLVTIGHGAANGQELNGFDVSSSAIPVDEIMSGGPPRDGIPALTHPAFEPMNGVEWLRPHDRLLALEQDGEAKAYPLRILNWHEIVNDELAGEPIVVTYCPLCGTGMAFDPRVGDQHLEFGVSGLLYNSDVLMYDRQTESLWSQIEREAVTGPLRGERLELEPLVHTTWAHWREQNANGLVLSRDTGHRRNYESDPYLSYASSQRTMFPVNHRDDRLQAKSVVLGITQGESAAAFPLKRLFDQPRPVREVVGGEELFVYYIPETETVFATTLEGDLVPATLAYWFAWSAFHPETAVWEPKSQTD
ncbi:MAG: DUF3179 domain-containing protein [Gemmatimonadota bacterium]